MMFNIKRLFYLGLLLPFTSMAQQVPVYRLDTLIARIERQNLFLKTYSLKAETYQHTAKAASAWMAPMIGAGTFMTPYPGQELMSDSDKGSIMIQLEQEIPNAAKLKSKRAYIESQAKVTLEGRAIRLNELRTEAKKFYYAWLVASGQLRVLKENEKIMEMMKKIEEIRLPFNQSKLSTVYQTQAKLEENANMMRMQMLEIDKSRVGLNALMSEHAEAVFEIDTLDKPVYRVESQLDTSVIAARRNDILQMDYAIASMNLNIEAMKKQAKPDFKVRFDHMSPLTKMMPKAYSVMGMVSIPIAPWSSSMYKSEAKAMTYEIEAMRKEKSAMLQETQAMLRSMEVEIKAMEKQIDAIERKILPNLKRMVDLNLLSYRENKMDVTAVLDSWEAYTMMQSKLWDEKRKMYLMIADYEKEIYR